MPSKVLLVVNFVCLGMFSESFEADRYTARNRDVAQAECETFAGSDNSDFG